MSAIRLAFTALGLASTAVRNPVIRAGIRAVVANPRLRAAAIETTKSAAYTAGRVARRFAPKKPVD